jgi:DNA-binding NarL/FixJ family response regulator
VLFSPEIATKMVSDYSRRLAGSCVNDPYETLSDGEREIFQLIAEAYSNKDIAKILSISPATVETHRSRVLQKLDIHSAAELVLTRSVAGSFPGPGSVGQVRPIHYLRCARTEHTTRGV